jgi:hypothetical protein
MARVRRGAGHPVPARRAGALNAYRARSARRALIAGLPRVVTARRTFGARGDAGVTRIVGRTASIRCARGRLGSRVARRAYGDERRVRDRSSIERPSPRRTRRRARAPEELKRSEEQDRRSHHVASLSYRFTSLARYALIGALNSRHVSVTSARRASSVDDTKLPDVVQ